MEQIFQKWMSHVCTHG